MSIKRHLSAIISAIVILVSLVQTNAFAMELTPVIRPYGDLLENIFVPNMKFTENSPGGPVISPQSISGSDVPIEVTVAWEPDHDIYYTLDGTEPTDNSAKYESAFIINYGKTVTVKAAAYFDGIKTGETASAFYSVQDKLANVVFTPGGGEYFIEKASNMEVSLTAPENSDIYYTLENTLDDSDPINFGSKYTGPLSIGTGVWMLKAVAVKAGMVTSDVASAYITEKTTRLSGTVSKDCTVTAKVGTKTYSATPPSKNWSLNIKKAKIGTRVTVFATIKYLTSPSVSKTVRPSPPTVGKVTSKSKYISGKTAFSKVKVYVTAGGKTYKTNSSPRTYRIRLKKTLRKKSKVTVYYVYNKMKSIQAGKTVV